MQSQPQGRLYLSNALSDDAISESDSDTSSASISSYSSEVSIEAPPISPLSSSTSESSDSDEDEDSTTTDAHTRLTAEVGSEQTHQNLKHTDLMVTTWILLKFQDTKGQILVINLSTSFSTMP